MHGLEVTDRNMDPRVPVASAGLDKQNAARGVGGEAIGEHATGRARADDYVVELSCGDGHQANENT